MNIVHFNDLIDYNSYVYIFGKYPEELKYYIDTIGLGEYFDEQNNKLKIDIVYRIHKNHLDGHFKDNKQININVNNSGLLKCYSIYDI